MATFEQLHQPRWQPDGATGSLWSAIARLPHSFKWLTSLEIAQYDIEQWWHHASCGECYNPRLHCDRPNCGCRGT